MLLDLKAEERRRLSRFSLVTGLLGVGALGAVLVPILARPGLSGGSPPALEGVTAPLGRALFSDYLLPFEIVSVLLLVAIVGVVLLSKKDLK
jgi:NADH-quinone oxidoreductase subunit J